MTHPDIFVHALIEYYITANLASSDTSSHEANPVARSFRSVYMSELPSLCPARERPNPNLRLIATQFECMLMAAELL